MMLPLRKSQIGEMLTNTGFKPIQFELVENSNDSYKLIYKHQRTFYFELKDNRTKFSPSTNGKISGIISANQWDAHFKSLQVWLDALKANLEVIDPWIELKDTFNKQESDSNTYEELFNEEERIKFSVVLDKLLEKMEALNIKTDQIAKDLEHLKEMSETISKKDIAVMLLGTGASYVIQGIIPTEAASSLLNFIQDSFTSFKGFLLS